MLQMLITTFMIFFNFSMLFVMSLCHIVFLCLINNKAIKLIVEKFKNKLWTFEAKRLLPKKACVIFLLNCNDNPFFYNNLYNVIIYYKKNNKIKNKNKKIKN